MHAINVSDELRRTLARGRRQVKTGELGQAAQRIRARRSLIARALDRCYLHLDGKDGRRGVQIDERQNEKHANDCGDNPPAVEHNQCHFAKIDCFLPDGLNFVFLLH